MDNHNNDFNNYEGQPNHELNERYGRKDSDYDRPGRESDRLRRYNDEEFATEFITDDHHDGNATSGSMIAGALGIITAIVAMFMHPVLFGLIGVALGIFAFSKGNKIIGIVAILMGLMAAAMPVLHTGPLFSMFS